MHTCMHAAGTLQHGRLVPPSMVCVCPLKAHGVGRKGCSRVVQCFWTSLAKGPSLKYSWGALTALAR